jgi:purine-nucleoside phosphorylase
MSLRDRMEAAAAYVKDRFPGPPDIGFVLGSGLGDFASSVAESTAIPFEKIPHFKKPLVAGHSGRLVLGEMHAKTVAVLQGRFHYYEGHSIDEVVFPVRVLCELGIETLVLTNAAGGINRDFKPGDLMVINDHINFMGCNPLIGENDDSLGTRFPDMSEVYSKDLLSLLHACMPSLREGVYAAMSGPSYETPAEIRMLARLGADAVGMSTVPEAIAARHMRVRVAGISCITNLAAGLSSGGLDHAEVTRTADRVKREFEALLHRFVKHL